VVRQSHGRLLHKRSNLSGRGGSACWRLTVTSAILECWRICRHSSSGFMSLAGLKAATFGSSTGSQDKTPSTFVSGRRN
jgi:hypothetical protein